MKSFEVLRDAAESVGVKALAARLNLSTALVYKWCQESMKEDPGSSGARNPLDRLKEIYDATRDIRLVNWICNQAGGFFVQNPEVTKEPFDIALLNITQRMVTDFGSMLSTVSKSIENDGQITPDEADHIRQAWENLKMNAERFVVACEQGRYARKR
ncbi:MAG: hypothetical protein KDA32_05445 [Phycisphaerales bacterium]|nr:hypothetical protein [Phycisphaerales bacterium]